MSRLSDEEADDLITDWFADLSTNKVDFCNKSMHAKLEQARFLLNHMENKKSWISQDKTMAGLSELEKLFEQELVDFFYGRVPDYVHPWPPEKVDAHARGDYDKYRKNEIEEMRKKGHAQ